MLHAEETTQTYAFLTAKWTEMIITIIFKMRKCFSNAETQSFRVLCEWGVANAPSVVKMVGKQEQPKIQSVKKISSNDIIF